MKNFKREYSAGCVVFKKLTANSSKLKAVFLLGKHSGYHKWVLPKGLIEEGEKGGETAIRETEEEIGVKCRLVENKPIHIEKYFFVANYEDLEEKSKKPRQKLAHLGGQAKLKNSKSKRRVEKYQEAGGEKTKVFKTVSFYLAEYVEGDPKDHGWEMEEAGWYKYDEALKLMAFKGEKEALKKAREKIKILQNQPSLF